MRVIKLNEKCQFSFVKNTSKLDILIWVCFQSLTSRDIREAIFLKVSPPKEPNPQSVFLLYLTCSATRAHFGGLGHRGAGVRDHSR